MSTKVKVWDLPVRVFHWLLAGSFAVAYAIAESDALRGVHVVLGYTVMALIAFRIVWGFVGSPFARFRSFAFSPATAIAYARNSFRHDSKQYLGHNPLGSYAIYAILLIGLATGVTGYMRLNEVDGESMEELHEVFANVWLAIVILHVAGVIVGSWVHRENLIRAMITGYKNAVQDGNQGENVVGNRAGGLAGRIVGILVLVGVAAFWLWASVTGYQPGERAAREHGQASEQNLKAARQDRSTEHETRLSDRADRND
jgi:cytochrome b